MLYYKAAQVIAAGNPVFGKAWEMPDERNPGKMRVGESNYCDVTVLSVNGSVAVIRLKGKTSDEVKAKVAKYNLGKPADIPVIKQKSNENGVLVCEG